MAQLTRDAAMLERTDFLLRYLHGAVSEVSSIAERWDDLDMIEKEDFHHDWVGSIEARLRDLGELSHRGELTPTQQRNYTQLTLMLERLRPTIDRMLQS